MAASICRELCRFNQADRASALWVLSVGGMGGASRSHNFFHRAAKAIELGHRHNVACLEPNRTIQRYGTKSRHVRSPRGDQPRPQTHQFSLARDPSLEEDVFEVGFRGRPGDAERCGGLGQAAPSEQAGEHLGFGWRQTKGGGNGIRTILRVQWRTDEDGGNGRVVAACGSRFQ
jgi:hypothetical protein